MKKRIITTEEAVSAVTQHTDPCSDCPWRTDAIRGWLGGMPADDWLFDAHGEKRIECHTLTGAQCAGAAIYRSNVAKKPRDQTLLLLPRDREKVFSNPEAFKKHHSRTA